VIFHAALDEAAELVLDLGDLRRSNSTGEPSSECLGPARLQPRALRGAQQLPEVGLGPEPAAGASGLGDLLGAGPQSRGEKAEIGERAPDS
jgi:hypothetical protein